MPRASLHFKLPEENEEFTQAIKAGTYGAFIDAFDEWLRRKYKHANPPSDAAFKEYEEIRDKWYEFKKDYIPEED
jgi:hypothetical protein